MNELTQQLQTYYRQFGPPKPMNSGSDNPRLPHFFLHRSFLGEQDLAILFYTKRCRYRCSFCALPYKAPLVWINAKSVKQQFLNVIRKVKHSIGIFERVTLANEGSVLDETTFPPDALDNIAESLAELPNVRKIVLESRLEFVCAKRVSKISRVSCKQIDVLTGFETLNESIRDNILNKCESIPNFLKGLDRIAEAGAELTTYILYKPDPAMDDLEAAEEAERSIDYVRYQCDLRGVPLTIRLNPMYVARGTPWAEYALSLDEYKPPRLSDVLKLANKKITEGMKIYIGLTSENLSETENTYRNRKNFSRNQLKQGILLNITRPKIKNEV